MTTSLLTRRIALLAGSAAIVGMGTLTAGCGSSTKEAPTSTTSTSSSAPALSPTEKIPVTQPITPSFEDRGGMDSAPCGPGKSKVNGICQ